MRPPPQPVHLAVYHDDVVEPLCGDWGQSKSWTKLRSAVTCPRCLQRLRPAP